MVPTYAERLLQGYGIKAPEEIDLEAIAFDQGARIRYRALTTCEARIVGCGSSAIISIRSDSHPDRKRFSLGHELGHWVQDKGMVSLACKRSDIGPQRANPGGSESQANLFASQLLMPDYLFRPMSARLPLTFESARPLRERFQTSLTATAIKMVRTGHYPGMVVCHEHGRLKWAMPGPDLPRSLQPVRELDSDSQAYDLWKVGSASDTRPQLTSAETWIDCESAEDYELVEHSILVADGVTVTLLWWKDESQVRDWQHRR